MQAVTDALSIMIAAVVIARDSVGRNALANTFNRLFEGLSDIAKAVAIILITDTMLGYHRWAAGVAGCVCGWFCGGGGALLLCPGAERHCGKGWRGMAYLYMKQIWNAWQLICCAKKATNPLVLHLWPCVLRPTPR